jgi:hypothetical protein
MLTRNVLQCLLMGVAVAGCATDGDGPVVDALPDADELLLGEPHCAEAGRRLGRDLGNRELTLRGITGHQQLDEVNRVTVTGDARAIDFAASVGIDAVLVRGGDHTRVYVYEPEALAARALAAAPMFRTGETRPISGVTFCYDHELVVTMTATPRLQRTRTWTIEVVPEQPTISMLAGKVAHPTFKVTAAPTGWIDERYSAYGRVVVANPGPQPAGVIALGAVPPERVEDVAAGKPTVVPLKLHCPEPVPFVMPPFSEVSCDYATTLPDASPRTFAVAANTVGLIGSGAGEVGFDFAEPQLDDRDAQVWVYHKAVGYLGHATTTKGFVYEVELGPYYRCPAVGWYQTQAMVVGLDTHRVVDGFGWLRVAVECAPTDDR